MSDFIREIPSDSTIVNVELKDNSAAITFKLDIYEDDKDTKIITFIDVEATSVMPGWQSDIEGIEIKDSSELLEKTKKLLIGNHEPETSLRMLRSYQILSSWNKNAVVIEIIASAYKIKEI